MTAMRRPSILRRRAGVGAYANGRVARRPNKLERNRGAPLALCVNPSGSKLMTSSDDVKQPERPKLLEIMGPGLITGASDDDPSGIATYSQVGAQFGFNLGW